MAKSHVGPQPRGSLYPSCRRVNVKVVFTVGWSREKGDLQGPLQQEEEDAGAPHGSQEVLGASWKAGAE